MVACRNIYEYLHCCDPKRHLPHWAPYGRVQVHFRRRRLCEHVGPIYSIVSQIPGARTYKKKLL